VPPFSLAVAAALLLPRETPLVVDYRDPWNARLQAPPLARVLRTLERIVARRADAITFASDTRLRQLSADVLGVRDYRIHAVPNGIDPQDLIGVPPDPPAAVADRPLDLVYSGQWYGCHGPGIIIDALAAVGPDVARLEVLGHLPGSIRNAMRDAVPAGGLHLTAPKPRLALYQRLQRADVALVTLGPTTAVESCLPAKSNECLAVGVPVIAICPPEAALLRMPGAARFHHVHHDDSKALIALLRDARANRSRLRRGAIEVEAISRERGVRELDRVLRAL
jgi:glycosyltransferase involved in cell wall biosynthesis